MAATYELDVSLVLDEPRLALRELAQQRFG
jgi:hypothetical protein